jgi:hypothetical protein
LSFISGCRQVLHQTLIEAPTISALRMYLQNWLSKAVLFTT